MILILTCNDDALSILQNFAGKPIRHNYDNPSNNALCILQRRNKEREESFIAP
jgi:hypothetical protein